MCPCGGELIECTCGDCCCDDCGCLNVPVGCSDECPDDCTADHEGEL